MSIKLLNKVHHMVRTITDEEFFIAGGAVVDSLYGVEPKDYDLVLCMGSRFGDEGVEAHALIESLSGRFACLGFPTKVYQSYGLLLGESINDTSFQSMFYSCMKVDMLQCQLDILLSKAVCIQEHVQRHDCNMNMVWFNGERVCWEHGGTQAKVDSLVFRDGVSEERQERMRNKYLKLSSLPV